MIAEPLLPLVRPVADLRVLEGNPRRGDVAAVKRSLQRFGQRKPIVVREDGTVIAGNHTLLAACELGWTEIAVVGTEDDDATAKAYALADNRTSVLGSFDTGDLALMAAEVHAVDPGLLEAASFTDKDLKALLAGQEVPPKLNDADDAPELPADPVTRLGDVWQLGPHRLICGDSTDAKAVAAVGGDRAALVLTDPPYCSGGFQEAGRSAGSVGTSAAHKQIANDRLSTRGYIALIRSVLAVIPAVQYAYVFTDWRMWVNLFDVVEASGYGVRSMIAWDKGTPGMGRGWRSQHELIMWAAKATPPFDKHAPGTGNVIQARRTGNLLHTTQKPVDLLIGLLEVAVFAGVVYDPFAGSGSTLMACHATRREAALAELDPRYCDVICRRYQEHTGTKPVLEATGEPHDFT